MADANGKPGWKTSEFYLTAIGMILCALAASGAFGPEATDSLVTIGAALAPAGYGVSRGMKKMKNGG